MRGAVELFDYGINLDGSKRFLPTTLSSLPGINDAGFDYASGLGTLQITITSVGDHFVGLFLDHEIDVPLNDFFNEFGSTTGTPDMGQTWEIDEPGFLFGDIETHFSNSTPSGSLLDNFNGVPSGFEEDVSMALGWNFTLASGEIATIEFHVSETAPTSGLYLTHSDPDSEVSIHFSSTLTTAVPEPSHGGALLLVGLLGFRRRRFH